VKHILIISVMNKLLIILH